MIINQAALVVVNRYNIFFNDDSDHEEKECEQNIDDFVEEVIPCFSGQQFKRHFRMTPETFDDFLKKIYCIEQENRTRTIIGHPEISLEKQSFMLIWLLGNMESFRSVASRFGVSKSVAWQIMNRMNERVLKLNRKFKIICWPNAQRAGNIMQTFHQRSGFPKTCIFRGCIDGSHIKITAPKIHPASYVNRKGYHSLLLQGVCDSRNLFLDVYAGQPGSLHDNNLFEKSPLFRDIELGQIEFYDGHLIGDLAYKLDNFLMVGFKDNGHLTARQKLFNHKLSQIRVAIENTFALLKGRFGKLKLLVAKRLDVASSMIITACILHNVCILNGDFPDDIMDITEEQENIRFQNVPHEEYYIPNRTAAMKREQIMNSFNINN